MRKSYGSHPVLDGIDLTVHEGETLVIETTNARDP